MYEKIEVSRWGEGIVETLAKDLQRAFPDMRGFSAQNLWRMKQIYETYKDHEKLSTLLRELPWSHNVLIVHHTSSIEEKEFYIKTGISERWSFRELQRQMESSLYERFMLSKKADKLIPHTKEKGFLAHFKDEYVFDFLGLKDNFTEGDLRKAILGNLKQFFLEFGRYFTFLETTVTTKHLAKGIAADYDSKGQLAGIEILDVVKRFGGQETLRQVITEGLGPSIQPLLS